MPRISRFSPNWSDPEALKAITVAREDLIAAAVEAVRDSSLTKSKHHLLFVGPRGSGKTHLVTLVHHRVSQMDDVMAGLRIAWLNEDETSDSLLSLLLRVHRALARDYPDQFPGDSAEAVYDLTDPGEATEAATDLLLRQLGEHTLLVLVENLDSLFAEFDEGEQKRWRALVQNHPRFCTVATAQRLFRGVSDREAPFFGFFEVHHLRPFTVEGAAEFLARVAREQEDTELPAFLRSPRGRARIRALHHLTGGNQRLFVILSEFIDRESLESLVAPFESLVDEQLTPYYQERLRWLPTLQRRIVELLCSVARPQPVKAIARRLFATSQTISSQLVDLRRMGYVESRKRGRESLYELAEPLMRLSHEVKEAKGRTPLRILVDFLRVWYDQEELKQWERSASEDAAVTRRYLAEAHARFEAEGNLRLRIFNEEADGIELAHCDEEQLNLLRDLSSESGDPKDGVRYGIALAHRGRLDEACQAFTEVIEREDAPVEQMANALVNRGVTYRHHGDLEAAIADYTAVIELGDAPVKQIALALVNRGLAFAQGGDTDAAIADYSGVIDRDDSPAEVVARALVNRAITHGKHGDVNAAMADYTAVTRLDDAPVDQLARALFNRGLTYGQRGELEAAVADLTKVIELHGAPPEGVLRSLINRGLLLTQSNDLELAIIDFSEVLDRGEAKPEHIAKALINRGVSYNQRGDLQAAMADYTAVINREDGPAEGIARALVNRGVNHSRRGDLKAAIADYTAVIESEEAPAEPIARAHFNSAAIEMWRGRWAEAEQHLRQAFARVTCPEDDYVGPIPDYLEAVLESGQSREVWKPRLDALLAIYRDNQALQRLAIGLVQSVAALRDSNLSPKGLAEWHALWAERGEFEPELELPARLLRTAIDYFAAGEDESLLLDLPSEERRILAQALGLEKETTGQKADPEQ